MNTFSLISDIIPSVNIYCGSLNVGANQIKYFASNSKSNMPGKVLKKGQGIAFDCIENLSTVVIQPEDLDKSKLVTEGSHVEVYYGKTPFKAKITRVCGHNLYDVVYDADGKKEQGVDLNRIMPLHAAFRIHKFSPIEFPFVSVPLRHRNKGFGVISLDTLTKIPKAPYDTQPEQGLLKFLEQIGRVLGVTIDGQRKKNSIKRLLSVSSNQNSTLNDVFEIACDSIESNLYYLESISIMRYKYEKEIPEQDRDKVEFIYRRGPKSEEVESGLNSYNPLTSNNKPVQKRTDKLIWFVFKLRPEQRGGEGKIYVMAISQAIPFQEPDIEFLESLQKIIVGTIQNLVTKKAVGEIRFEALQEIRLLCNNWSNMNRTILFEKIADSVTSCFYNTNMYFGQLGMFNKEIKYTLASEHSNMKGNKLLRSMKDSVSFNAIDTLSRVAITQMSVNKDSIHHFGAREEFDYPFIVIPIISHLDIVIGILGADNCDEPGSDPERVGDIMGFYGTIGSYFSPAIWGYILEDTIEKLKRSVYESLNYRQGLRAIKKVILSLLPFACKVTEMIYEPKELTSLRSHDILGDIDATTEDSYLVLVHISNPVCLSKTIKSPTLTCIWQGKTVSKFKVKKNTEISPFSIIIPEGVAIDRVYIQLVLRGTIDEVDKEICRKSISLYYIMNTPLYVMEHTLDSMSLKTVHAAKVNIISKVFYPNQSVAYVIKSISIKGLAKTDLTSLTDSFVSIKWNDVEVAKTSVNQNSQDPVWSDINITLKLKSQNYKENTLVLEVWDQDILGRGEFLGRVEYSGEELDLELRKDTTPAWINLGYNPLIKESLQKFVKGRLKIVGVKIIASEMNSEQILGELNASSSIGDADANFEGESETKRIYHNCELTVIKARDLGINESWGSTTTNPFVIIYFNGDEIGRTPAVKDTLNPIWEEETFLIRAPGGDDLELSVLSIEVFDMQFTGKGNFLGCIEITGKNLMNLVASQTYKRKWFDLGLSANLKVSDQININGELLLGGRPANIAITGKEEDPKELGFLEINVLAAANLPISLTTNISTGTQDYYMIWMDIILDKRNIFSTKRIHWKDDHVIWSDEVLIFRHPNNKPLQEYNLKFNIYCQANKSKPICIGTNILKGVSLMNFLGQGGYKTQWTRFKSEDLNLPKPKKQFESLEEDKNKGNEDNIVPEVEEEEELIIEDIEIKLRGGLQGTLDINDDDGREIHLDILAASSLPIHKNGAHGVEKRTSPFCKIFWNKRAVGETKVCSETSDPIWDRQRFTLKTPYIDGMDNSLPTCELKIDILDKGFKSDVLIGSVILSGEALDAFLGGQYSSIKWFPILNYSNKISTNTSRNDDIIDLGSIKIRGGFAGSVIDPNYDSGEYELNIVAAQELMRSEAFRGN